MRNNTNVNGLRNHQSFDVIGVVLCPWVASIVLLCGTIFLMKRKHQRTLEAVFARPVSGNLHWRDLEALFLELGADISEREGSRVAVFLFGEVRVFHRPHPGPTTDKGAVASIRKWLEQHKVYP